MHYPVLIWTASEKAILAKILAKNFDEAVTWQVAHSPPSVLHPFVRVTFTRTIIRQIIVSNKVNLQNK